MPFLNNIPEEVVIDTGADENLLPLKVKKHGWNFQEKVWGMVTGLQG